MADEVNTYTAIARPEHDGWDVEVVEADRSHTWAPTLTKARQFAREVAAAWFDQAMDDVDVVLTVDGAADELAAARAKRAAADQATAEAAAATQAAIDRLAALGLSVRDSAAVVGLSHQRVAQLRPKV